MASALVWWFAYRAPARPGTAPIEGLTAPVEVTWSPQQIVTLRAEADRDAWAALGYAHGMERAWSAVLWRRTALGRLAEWFGPTLRPIDAHTRRLGLAAGARDAYLQLDSTVQNHLRAYTHGMNAALASSRVRDQAEFALLDTAPVRWAPWHTLAVERLFAWLGTPRPSAPHSAPDTVHAFVDADARLRQWLHLHGLRRSVVWSAPATGARDNASPSLVHRIVTGASALPTIQEVTVQRPGHPPLSVGTVPGTPLLWTGARAGSAWGVLPTSSAHLAKQAIDSSAVARRYERIETADGRETLVPVVHTADRLLLRSPPVQSDSAWTLAWSGWGAVTDVATWTRLFEDTTVREVLADAPFRLVDGNGLHVDPSGASTVLGTPPVADPVPGGVFVGPSPWAQRQAESLHRFLRRPRSGGPGTWSASDSSTWAAERVPSLLSAVAPLDRPDAPPLLRDAVTYLRNWDAAFDPSSIGASLFEGWMRAYRQRTSSLPPTTDSLFFAPYQRQQAFVEAVRTLAAQYGPDLRRWRWENVAPHRRFFPVWSADSLVAADLSRMATTQFAPLARQGAGHVSALAGGPSLAIPTWPAPSPASWTGWTTAGRTSLTVRRFRFNSSAFMARPFMPRGRPPPVALPNRPVEATTRLVPP